MPLKEEDEPATKKPMPKQVMGVIEKVKGCDTNQAA